MGGNVILCGFMGCGKSTLGAALAQQLGRDFIDADLYLEQQCQKTIPEIFLHQGEAEFRRLEHQVLRQLVTRSNLVIATGGGALAQPQNPPVLRQGGVVLFLNPGFEECYRRIAHTDRPLVQQNSQTQLHQLYLTRQELYRKHCHREFAGVYPLPQLVEQVVDYLDTVEGLNL